MSRDGGGFLALSNWVNASYAQCEIREMQVYVCSGLVTHAADSVHHSRADSDTGKWVKGGVFPKYY